MKCFIALLHIATKKTKTTTKNKKFNNPVIHSL